VDLKSSFECKKKSTRNLFHLSLSLCTFFSILFSVSEWIERKGEVLKGHFKNISERSIKKTTAPKEILLPRRSLRWLCTMITLLLRIKVYEEF
jgi:hypothetical protein